MNVSKILVAGNELPETIKIISLSTKLALQQIPQLILRLSDGSANSSPFKDDKQEDTALPKIGDEITLEAGYGDEKKPIFKGLIMERQLGIDGEVYLEITAYGELIKLTETSVTQLFTEKDKTNDSDIISALVKDITIEVPEKSLKHDQYFVFQQTPWRALMSRVLANGFLLEPTLEGCKIVDLSTDKNEPTVHALELSSGDLAHFSFHQDSRSHIAELNSNQWAIGKDIKAEEVKAALAYDGKIKALPETSTIEKYEILQAAPIEKLNVQARINANLFYRQLDHWQGKLSFYLSANSPYLNIKLFDIFELGEDINIDYQGKYLVTAIEHKINQSGWQLEVTLGLHLNYTLYSGWVTQPPIPHLAGKVHAEAIPKAEPDDKQRHVPVELPSIAKGKTIWARLLSPFASKETGFFFPPNAGDEVVVGFIGGDCRYPVILGSTHNEENKPPIPFKDGFKTPGIYFKEKEIELSFELEKPTLTLKGGKEAEIVIKEESGLELTKGKSSMSIGDDLIFKRNDKPVITLDDNITLKTDKDVIVETKKMEVK